MKNFLQLRRRRGRLPALALILTGFLALLAVVLAVQLITMLVEPTAFDWLLGLMLGTTLLIFLIMGLGVFWLDFEQDLILTAQGITIVPVVFSAYTIPWDDIERLELRESNGFRMIEYRLRSSSPSYQARISGNGQRRLLALESRTGGFHGAIPAESYRPFNEAVGGRLEQHLLKINKLFPILRRYWLNPEARLELAQTDKQ